VIIRKYSKAQENRIITKLEQNSGSAKYLVKAAKSEETIESL